MFIKTPQFNKIVLELSKFKQLQRGYSGIGDISLESIHKLENLKYGSQKELEVISKHLGTLRSFKEEYDNFLEGIEFIVNERPSHSRLIKFKDEID